MQPNGNGYVTFNYWTTESAAEQIVQIEATQKGSARDQARRLGIPVEFIGWCLPPTLDRERSVMYQTTDWSFDGAVTTNADVTILDRSSYVTL